MNITISGDLGSGKTTAAALLGRDGWNVISTGMLFRKAAAEQNCTVAELTELCRDNDGIDLMLDGKVSALGSSEDHTVFDCRLGYHLVPNAANIMLVCDSSIAARRVMEAGRQGERYANLPAAVVGLAARRDAERERFWKLYRTDPWDKSNYDLVIDTTRRTPEEVARCIEDYAMQRQRSEMAAGRSEPKITFPELRIERGQLSTTAAFTIDVADGRKYEAQFSSWKSAPKGMLYSATLSEIKWDGMRQVVWSDSSENLKELAYALEKEVHELQDQALDRPDSSYLLEDAGAGSCPCVDDEEMER